MSEDDDRDRRDLATRVEGSAWGKGTPGLVRAVAALDHEVGADQARLPDRAVELAQPGMADPRRLARHAAAASVSRVVRTATQLPGMVVSRRPLADPQGWLRDSAVEAFVDQLALAGAAGAELARLIAGAGALFPQVLRTELAGRDPRPIPFGAAVAQSALDETAGEAPGVGTPLTIEGPALTGTPVSQLHVAESADGRLVFARVRRPRIARDLDSDARLAAGAAVALQRVAPDVGGMGPLGFVRLVMRQTLESTDLRFEALGLVELGLIVEELDLVGLEVVPPMPLRLSNRALTLEHREGVALIDGGPVVPAAVRALVGITLESALVHGRFWADPAAEHLLVAPDGHLILVGVGTLGRFTPELRLAGVRTLKGVLTGDFVGMLEGMTIAGAMSDAVDQERLLADLAASDALNPMVIFTGGEQGLMGALHTVVEVMLENKLEPPVEVVLLLRTIFAVNQLIKTIAPDGTGLVGGLMELMPRLPDLIADAEAAVEH